MEKLRGIFRRILEFLEESLKEISGENDYMKEGILDADFCMSSFEYGSDDLVNLGTEFLEPAVEVVRFRKYH